MKTSRIAFKSRVFYVDVMRCIAIVLMVIFHFAYDLNYLGIIDTNIPNGRYWAQFRWLILTLFLLCVGISLVLQHKQGVRFTKWFKAFFRLGACALVVSLASWMLVPKNWIFFGVLHFIAASYVLALPFICKPHSALIVGCTIIAVGAMQILPNRWPFYLFFNQLPVVTNDYVQLFPWFGVVLVGIFIGHQQKLKTLFPNPAQITHLHRIAFYISRHSLSIYMIHQPILLALLWTIVNI